MKQRKILKKPKKTRKVFKNTKKRKYLFTNRNVDISVDISAENKNKHNDKDKDKDKGKGNDKTKTSNKNSICAPYIEPTDLSTDIGLSDRNMNIIKSATDETCFTIEALHKIADKWNETNPSMHIDYNHTTTGKSLWRSLNNVMSAKCNNEVCWIKQDFIKDSPLAMELLKNFKPLMPKKWEDRPNEWLNTLDIRDVMNQYEVKYPNFEFIGPVPMDFDTKVGFGQCVINELCNIKLQSLLDKGKNRIGVVFNLDKHTQSGSHWVAMHCGISTENKTGEICYWDSYGIKPNPEVVVLMNKLQSQGNELGYNLRIKVNNVRHQYKNSECGVYCIYFLTSILEGKSFEEIIKNIITDDKMNSKRSEFFAKV